MSTPTPIEIVLAETRKLIAFGRVQRKAATARADGSTESYWLGYGVGLSSVEGVLEREVEIAKKREASK